MAHGQLIMEDMKQLFPADSEIETVVIKDPSWVKIKATYAIASWTPGNDELMENSSSEEGKSINSKVYYK